MGGWVGVSFGQRAGATHCQRPQATAAAAAAGREEQQPPSPPSPFHTHHHQTRTHPTPKHATPKHVRPPPHLGVNYHPRAAAQLAAWGEVHEHRLSVRAQHVHDQCAGLGVGGWVGGRGFGVGGWVCEWVGEAPSAQALTHARTHPPTCSTPSNRSRCPPLKPRQLASTKSGRPSSPNSSIACAVLSAESGNHTCPACAQGEGGLGGMGGVRGRGPSAHNPPSTPTQAAPGHPPPTHTQPSQHPTTHTTPTPH